MSHKCHSVVTIESIEPEIVTSIHSRSSLYQYLLSIGRYVKPYFSVANNRIPSRILSSMAPPLFFPEFQRVYSDMKGPSVIVILLAGILLYGLHSPQRTIMTEVLVTAKLTVGYWLSFSFLAFFLGYFCETNLKFSQLLSITGYSLTGHCVVLLIAEVLHQEESHSVFFFLTTVFGGLATGRLTIIMLARTPGPGQRLVMCSTLACIHLMHLIYIHFAFMRKQFSV